VPCVDRDPNLNWKRRDCKAVHRRAGVGLAVVKSPIRACTPRKNLAAISSLLVLKLIFFLGTAQAARYRPIRVASTHILIKFTLKKGYKSAFPLSFPQSNTLVFISNECLAVGTTTFLYPKEGEKSALCV